jgi:hypothetical protein
MSDKWSPGSYYIATTRLWVLFFERENGASELSMTASELSMTASEISMTASETSDHTSEISGHAFEL